MRLSKQQERSRVEIAKELSEAGYAVERRFSALLHLLQTTAAPVNEAIRRYNAALLKAAAFAEAIGSDFRSDIDDKSERWQESEAGQQAVDFVEEWEGFSADALPEIAILEPELEEKPCHAKALLDLPSDSQ